MIKNNFIKTSDEETAEKLRKENFTELSKEGSVFVFINDGKKVFSEDDKKNITYTNILSC